MDAIENPTINLMESLLKWFLGVHFSISPFLESAFKAFEDTEQSLEGLDERRHVRLDTKTTPATSNNRP